jgi:hypothetical protein
MKISAANNEYGGYVIDSYSKKQRASNDFIGYMSVTSQKVEKQEEGEVRR